MVRKNWMGPRQGTPKEPTSLHHGQPPLSQRLGLDPVRLPTSLEGLRVVEKPLCDPPRSRTHSRDGVAHE